MILTVQNIIRETADAVSVVFKNGILFNRIRYKAGQFLTVNLNIDGKMVKRAYSFSSSPDTDDFLRITVKKVNGGLVSNFICDKLAIGDKVKVEKASGEFYVQPKKNKQNQYVFFGGGSGITPIFSIVKTLLKREPNSQIILIYANKNREAIIFKDDLEKFEKSYSDTLSVIHVLEDGDLDQPNSFKGFVTQNIVEKILKEHIVNITQATYMLCGPGPYMDAVKDILKSFSVPQSHVKYEAFSLDLSNQSGEDLLSNVVITKNNQQHVLSVKGNSTILQAAINQDIHLPYSCQSGMCSSCKATCLSGEVRMIDGHILSDEEVANNQILTCISFPKTEEVLISFDQ